MREVRLPVSGPVVWLAEEAARDAGLDLVPNAFIAFLENHDQVANSAFGRRLHQTTSPARLRALTALTLLGPETPLLFQGQEFAASAPFLYFADHKEELREPINAGPAEFLSQFQSVDDPEVVRGIPTAGGRGDVPAKQAGSRRARAASPLVGPAPRSAAAAP